MKRIIKWLILVCAAICLWGYGSLAVVAAGIDSDNELKTRGQTETGRGTGNTSEIEQNLSYSTTDPTEAVRKLFEEILEQDGNIYQLLDVQTKIVDIQPETPETVISIVSDPVYEASHLDDHPPAGELVKDGTAYYLVSSEIISRELEPRMEYGETTIGYEDLEDVNDLPIRGEITVDDILTGKQYTYSVPRIDYTINAEHWTDDFTFPITIYSPDADYFLLGDQRIPGDAVLSRYGTEFLTYLDLDPGAYQIDTIIRTGAPALEYGEWVQHATAYGRRKTMNITALFAGDIELPGVTSWQYQSLYSNVNPQQEPRLIYHMEAAARYRLHESVIQDSQELSWWQYLARKLLRLNLLLAAVVLAIVVLVIRVLLKDEIKRNRRENGQRKTRQRRETTEQKTNL